MNSELKHHLEQNLGRIVQIRRLTGGDISSVYRISTSVQEFLVKVNEGTQAQEMFQQEADGLYAIRITNTIGVPQVHHLGEYLGQAFLVMDYIPTKSPAAKDFENLAVQLAALHQIPHSHYGFTTNNFIGSLVQDNKFDLNWPSFYAHRRLLPQLELARQQRLYRSFVPDKTSLQQVCQKNLYSDFPSLIHGDLWGGNFLIGAEGRPYLIDPATYYGHHLVDIAMSKLFGGFGDRFYQIYAMEMSGIQISQVELDLYQLYYLLVHLNIFGTSYLGPVSRIMDRYF